MEDRKPGKLVRVAGLQEFEAEAGSESLDAESPLAKEIVRKANKCLDEEEEEDVDVHFKRKRKESSSRGPPRKKQVVRKPPRRSQPDSVRAVSSVGEEESAAYVPPSDSLIAQSFVQEDIHRKIEQAPGKIIFSLLNIILFSLSFP